MYTTSYNSTRQYNFLQRQTSLFRDRWAIAAAAIFGLLLIITVFTGYVNPGGLDEIRSLHYFIFFLAGLIFTSQIFMELNSPNQAYSFLTLPVSTLEKLLGSWLLSSPIYIIAYSLVSFFIYLLGTLVAGLSVSPLEFFSAKYWDSVGSYMIVQTIFLWGACYFRKNNFLKTVLTCIVVMIGLGIYAGLLGWLLYGGTNVQIDATSVEESSLAETFSTITQGLTWLLAPYMLLVSYFTLKERQL